MFRCCLGFFSYIYKLFSELANKRLGRCVLAYHSGKLLNSSLMRYTSGIYRMSWSLNLKKLSIYQLQAEILQKKNAERKSKFRNKGIAIRSKLQLTVIAVCFRGESWEIMVYDMLRNTLEKYKITIFQKYFIQDKFVRIRFV